MFQWGGRPLWFARGGADVPAVFQNTPLGGNKYKIKNGCLDKEKYSERPVYLRLRTDKEAAAPVRLEYETMRKNFGSVWVNILKCKFQLDQYKRTLIMLNEKVHEL